MVSRAERVIIPSAAVSKQGRRSKSYYHHQKSTKMHLSTGMLFLFASLIALATALPDTDQPVHARVLRQSYTGACLTTCSNLSAPIEGILKIHILRAHSLPDTDGAFQGRSDPFTIVTAFRYFGSSSVSKSTAVKQGTHDPVFDETLNFGCDKWRSLSIGVLDSDCGRDEVLIPFESFPICSVGRCSVQHASGSSWLNFDIEVIPVNNGC